MLILLFRIRENNLKESDIRKICQQPPKKGLMPQKPVFYDLTDKLTFYKNKIFFYSV